MSTKPHKIMPGVYTFYDKNKQVSDSHASHNDVSVNNRLCIRRWSH